ncbi:hypothetical protein K501DRAFT_288793 [Backusella circina FSU 941]|nr:hypothetical protein K501DRAFT_288793 [Backusella circina FSU 941]
MSVSDASKEVNMNLKTATTYYEMYMNDPEHKIPLPRRRQSNSGGLKVTHDQVKALIDCIVNRGMKLGTAATTTKMQYHTAQRYYDKYMSDPDRNIPVPGYEGISPSTQHLSDKIKILIGHIVDDKLSLNAASIKAKLCPKTAKKYYTQYLQDPEHKIPVPATRNYQVSYGSKGPTFEQVVILIRHIVDDNMSVMAAAKEAGMSVETSRRYYNRYLADPNRKIPNPKEKRVFSEKGCTKEQIELMISAIEEDNMSLSAAAIKVGMAINTGSMYYHMYKEDPEHKIPIPLVKGARRDPLVQPTLAQYEQFNNYMVNDHLSTRKAALKAKLVPHRAKMYYDKYMNE